MTTISDLGVPAPGPAPVSAREAPRGDRRGSWIPTWGMITTRFMELRRRRGLMMALIAVNIGIPVVFLVVRLVSHAVDPKSFGPAGGYNVFTGLVAGVLFIFGFIVAAAVGCTAGSVDLSEGMFRHLVITGRSRLALYLARIPAGLVNLQVPCGNSGENGPPPGATVKTPKGTVVVPEQATAAQIRAFAVAVANENYSAYRSTFLACN